MRYTWDKKLILRLYKDKAVREELTGLLQTYLGLFDYLNNSHFPVKKTIQMDRDFVSTYTFVEDIMNEFLYKCKTPTITDEGFLHKFTKEDALNLTASFYNSLDEDIKKYFDRLFKERFNHLRFTCSINSILFSGGTFHSNIADETFIVSQYNKTFANILTLIHEYAHAISFQLNRNKMTEVQNDLFCEIEAVFMELVAMDYFEKNFPEYKSDIYESRLDCYISTISDAISVCDKFEFDNIFKDFSIDPNKKSFLEMIMLLKRETNLNYSQLLCIFNLPAIVISKYPLGTLVAIELYKVYEENPNEAFNLYRRIIQLNGLPSKQMYEELKKMGLNPSTNIDILERKLTKN